MGLNHCNADIPFHHQGIDIPYFHVLEFAVLRNLLGVLPYSVRTGTIPKSCLNFFSFPSCRLVTIARIPLYFSPLASTINASGRVNVLTFFRVASILDLPMRFLMLRSAPCPLRSGFWRYSWPFKRGLALRMFPQPSHGLATQRR